MPLTVEPPKTAGEMIEQMHPDLIQKATSLAVGAEMLRTFANYFGPNACRDEIVALTEAAQNMDEAGKLLGAAAANLSMPAALAASRAQEKAKGTCH